LLFAESLEIGFSVAPARGDPMSAPPRRAVEISATTPKPGARAFCKTTFSIVIFLDVDFTPASSGRAHSPRLFRQVRKGGGQKKAMLALATLIPLAVFGYFLIER
jgi:hypothetical protein